VTRIAIACLLVACGGDDDGSSRPDAAAGTSDAAVDGASGLPTTCTGTCQTTALVAQMMSTRTLNRAYFGVTAADSTLHVEVYLGGGSGCPTMTSPTPNYTVVLGRVPIPTSTAAVTSPGNFLDYEGDMLDPNMVVASASSVSLTPVAYQAQTFVALDAVLTFAAGTVSGPLYATHCASLDTP
jgi:hypothetical protein